MVAVPITPGMTEWAEAQQYGVPVAAVESANSYAPTDLPVGGTLIVPVGGSYSSWTPARSSSDESDDTQPVSSPVSISAAPGSFQSCVISRESGGNAQAVNPSSGAGGLYQFLPSTWASTPEGQEYPGGAQTAPASVQNEAFSQVYAQDGTSPWASYDGC